ncbi:hypothetical protein Tco_1256543 [Tanacetum coccineum]
MYPICFRFEYIMVENFKGIQAEYEGLYALIYEEDVPCVATIVRSFKLIEVYIEHGVMALDYYIRPPQFRETIKEITNEPGSLAPIEHRSEKMLFTPCKDSVYESVTLRCMPHCMLTPPSDESVITYTQLSGIQGVDIQDHDGESGFTDVARSGVESFGLSHDESFGVDNLDLNLNEPMDLNVSQIETQSELLVSEELDVGRTHKPFVAEVRTQEPIVEEVRTQEPIMEDVIVKDYVSSGEDVEQGIDVTYETEYDVQSIEDAGLNDDDEDEDFLVDKENEIVEPDVDVHLFCISMDVPFDNSGASNLVLDDVLKGEDVDVIIADGFESNAYVRVRARCNGNVPIFTMSQGTGPTGSNCGMEVGPSGSSSPSNRSKKKKNTCIDDDSQACSSTLDAHDKRDLCPWVLRELLGLDGAFMKGPFPGQVLAVVRLDSNYGIHPITNVLVEAESRDKSDLLLNNICEVLLTLTTTKIMESIKKEAQLMNVHWNRANKYQVSGGNNAEASGLSAADGASGACSACVGVDGQGSSHSSRWTKRKEVIMNGDAPTAVALASTGAEGPIPPKTIEQKLARKNELKAKSTLLLAILDEHLLKFHGVKVAKSLWEAIKNSPQLDNEDLEQIDTDYLEEMDLKWQVTMLTMRVKRFIKKIGRKMDLNDKETVVFDRTKVECYNYHRRCHFAKECNAPRNQGNKNIDAPRRNASVDTSTTNALVVQDGIGGYDWSFQTEEGITNFALMAYTS